MFQSAEIIKNWKIERLVSKGNWGNTYSALNINDGERAIVKEYVKEAIPEKGHELKKDRENKDGNYLKPSVSPKFEAENMASRLAERHHQVLRCLDGAGAPKELDFFTTMTTTVLVLEYIEGEDLRTYTNHYYQHTKMNEKTAYSFAIKIAELMNIIHKNVSGESVSKHFDN